MTATDDKRFSPTDPATRDHHLWRNGRVWWIAFTFHTHEGKKHRVRRSLATSDVERARVKRDELLAQYAARPGWKLALRYARPRSRRVDEREPACAPVGQGFLLRPLSA